MTLENRLYSYPLICKFLASIICFLIITPPINSWIKLVLFSLTLIIIFSSKFKKRLSINYLYIILLFLLFIPKFYISNNSLILNHIVLPTSSSGKYDYVGNYFEPGMSKILKKELSTLEKKESLLKKINQPGSSNRSTLYKNYAFQSENLWTNLDEGKKIILKRKINYWDLGPSALNDKKLNFGNTKKENYETNIIFPVLFKINFVKQNHNTTLCFKGNLIFKDKIYKIIKTNNPQCLKIKKDIDYYYIDFDQSLELEIKQNFLYDNLIYFFYIIILVQLFLLLKIFIKFDSINYFYLFLNLSFYLLVFIYLKFAQPISGYSETIYFNRGSDAMKHYGNARIMLINFFNGNFYEAFRGVEDAFYYMPLLRYINSLFMIFFGETVLGSILIISFFAILIFKILNPLLDKKISSILTIIFVFIPIFETLGFSIISYIGFTIKGYGEGLAYFFLIYITYLFLLNKKNNLHFFLIGFFSFIVIGLRPNYLVLLFSLILFYSLYLIYFHNFNKNILKLKLKIFLMFFGASFCLLFLAHNYYYSGKFILFVVEDNLKYNLRINFSDYLIMLKSIFEENFNSEIMMKIVHHLRTYIKPYEFWFIITLLNLPIVIFLRLNDKITILSLSLLLMHSTYLFFQGVPRYSLGVWLISFIVLIYSIYHFYYPLIKAKFLKLK